MLPASESKRNSYHVSGMAPQENRTDSQGTLRRVEAAEPPSSHGLLDKSQIVCVDFTLMISTSSER